VYVGLQMECLTTWRQGNKIYLIARLLGRNTAAANCFVRIFTLQSHRTIPSLLQMHVHCMA